MQRLDSRVRLGSLRRGRNVSDEAHRSPSSIVHRQPHNSQLRRYRSITIRFIALLPPIIAILSVRATVLILPHVHATQIN